MPEIIGLDVGSHDATCFSIHAPLAWAHVYVSHGQRDLRYLNRHEYDWHDPKHLKQTWVSVSVTSDYGQYGHVWSNCGSDDWITALTCMGKDYALKKLAWEKLEVWKTGDALIDEARTQLRDLFRNGSITRKQNQEMFEAIPDTDEYSGQEFVNQWIRDCQLVYDFGLYEGRWKVLNPQVEGFWQEVWVPFMEYLKTIASQDVKTG